MSAGPAALLNGWVRALRAPVGRQISRMLAAVDAPPPGLKAGPRPAGSRSPDLPVALVLLFGADEAAVQSTATDLAATGAQAAVRPLLVLDRPAFRSVRTCGLAVEHVTDPQTWARHGEAGPWAEHLGTRLAQLRRDYSTDLVLALPPGGTRALPEGALAQWLRIEPPPAATALRRRLAVAVERFLDPSARG